MTMTLDFASSFGRDGDRIYMTYNARGVPGRTGMGTWTFVGGTGKFSTISGSGKLNRYNLRPAAEGTFQGVSISEGTWKIE